MQNKKHDALFIFVKIFICSLCLNAPDHHVLLYVRLMVTWTEDERVEKGSLYVVTYKGGSVGSKGEHEVSKYQWWGADLRRGDSDPDPSAHFDLDPVLGIPILIFVLVYVNNSIISKLHFLGYYVELPCSFNQPSDVNKKKFKSSSYGVRQQAFFITYYY